MHYFFHFRLLLLPTTKLFWNLSQSQLLQYFFYPKKMFVYCIKLFLTVLPIWFIFSIGCNMDWKILILETETLNWIFPLKKPSLPYVTTKINHRMKKIWTSFKKWCQKNRVKKGLSMFIFLHIFYKVEKWILCNETII